VLEVFREYLRTQGVQLLVVALESGPKTFRQLTEAGGFSADYTKKIRDKMAAWGLINVTWISGTTQQHELTALGKRFLAYTYKQAELLEEGARTAAKATRDDEKPL